MLSLSDQCCLSPINVANVEVSKFVHVAHALVPKPGSDLRHERGLAA